MQTLQAAPSTEVCCPDLLKAQKTQSCQQHDAAARPTVDGGCRKASADIFMEDANPCQGQRPCPSKLAAAGGLPWPRCQGRQLSGGRLLGCDADSGATNAAPVCWTLPDR